MNKIYEWTVMFICKDRLKANLIIEHIQSEIMLAAGVDTISSAYSLCGTTEFTITGNYSAGFEEINRIMKLIESEDVEKN